MSKSFIWKIVLGLSFISLLAGCVQVFEEETKEEAVTEGEVVIGALLPLSGEAAVYGLPMQRVLQIAQKNINDAGGVKAKKIKLEFEDGGCSADMANKAVTNLVSLKKVKFIIGGLCSSETLTAAPVVEENKVILLSPASGSPKITTAGDFVFRNYPSDNAQGEALADFAFKKGYKKVGLLVEEQPYTEGIADTFTAAFTKAGGEAVQEKFAQDTSDFKTQITKLQEAKVEMFFVNMQAPPKAGIIVKQLQEAGVKGPLMLNDVIIDAKKEVIEPFKDYVEGSVGALVPYDKTNPALPKLQEAYKALANNEEIPYLSYMTPSYDTLFIFKEAIEAVGEDPVKVKEYLYTVKGRKGLAGTLSFDANGDPGPEYRHALKIVKNGVVEDYVEDTTPATN